MLVHQNDAAREQAYDRTSAVGGHDKVLDEPKANGWTVVDMQTDRLEANLCIRVR